MADNSISGIESQIERNRSQYRSATEAVNANRNLSAEGRRSELARLKNEADQKHEQLKASHKQAIASERQRLYESAFSYRPISLSPAEREKSYRDAYTLAEASKTPADLQRLAARAIRTNDSALETAVAQFAFDHGVDGVLVEDDPRIAALLEFDATYGGRASAQAKFVRALALSAPSPGSSLPPAHAPLG